MDKETNALNLIFLPAFIFILLIGGGALTAHLGKIAPVNGKQLTENVYVFFQQGKKGIARIWTASERSKNKGKVFHKVIHPAKYDKIEVLKGQKEITHFLGWQNSRVWILPNNRSQLKKELYSCEKILQFNEKDNFLHIEDEGKKWLATRFGEKIVPYTQSIKKINSSIIKIDDKFLIYLSNNKTNELFDKIVSPIFTNDFTIKPGYRSHNNFLAVKKDGKWGAVDYIGRPILPCTADEYKFEELQNSTFLFLRKGKKWTYINGYTKTFKFEYDSLKILSSRFGSKNIFFSKGSTNGILDLGGREIYQNENVEISAIKNGPGFKVTGNGKTKILNYTGEQLFERKGKFIKYLDQQPGIYVFEQEGKLSLINDYKKKVYDKPLEDVEPLDKYHLVITENGKKGIIDMMGNKKLPVAFDDISYSSNRRKLIITHKPLLYEFNSTAANIDSFKQHELTKPIPEPIYSYVFKNSFNSFSRNYVSSPKIMVNDIPYIGLVVSIKKQASDKLETWLQKWDEVMGYEYKINNHTSHSKTDLLKKLKETKPNTFKLHVHSDSAFPFNFYGKTVRISTAGKVNKSLDVQCSYINLNGNKVYKIDNDHLFIFKLLKK